MPGSSFHHFGTIFLRFFVSFKPLWAPCIYEVKQLPLARLIPPSVAGEESCSSLYISLDYTTKPNASENRKWGKKKLCTMKTGFCKTLKRSLFSFAFSFNFGRAFVSRLKLAYFISFFGWTMSFDDVLIGSEARSWLKTVQNWSKTTV